MSIVDWLTLLVLIVCIWTFLPQRAQDGTGPAIRAAADAVRAVARPALGALGALIRWLFGVEREAPVNHSTSTPRAVTSSALELERLGPLSSQDGQPDGQPAAAATYAPVSRAELLTLYKLLRKYGVPREEARAALKAVRVPLSNDVWAQAAPPAPTVDDDARLEEVAQRAVRRERWYPDDPDLEPAPPPA